MYICEIIFRDSIIIYEINLKLLLINLTLYILQLLLLCYLKSHNLFIILIKCIYVRLYFVILLLYMKLI